jgi:hypothetical protein
MIRLDLELVERIKSASDGSISAWIRSQILLALDGPDAATKKALRIEERLQDVEDAMYLVRSQISGFLPPSGMDDLAPAKELTVELTTD